jgi:hypothetical protein
MPLKKILFKPGVNRENTRYTNEGGWYESDKIRFRQGTPQKIGGWLRISANIFQGICRSLWNWVTLGGQNLLGVGTNLKFYIENGGAYNNITPIRTTVTLTTNYFTTNTSTNAGGKTTVTVNHTAHGAINNDFVTISYGGSAPTVGGVTVAIGEYQITYVSANSYTISVTGTASSNATGPSSSTTAYFIYQINVGPATAVPNVGWGAGLWGSGTWGYGTTSSDALRLWNQINWGENLIYGPRGAPLYYWNASIGVIPSIVSISVATPAVVTSTVTVVTGTPFTFSTSGALPTGLIPGAIYYAIASTGTSFNVSLTAGGATINTTGAGSGTAYINPNGTLLTGLAGTDGYCPLYQNTFTVSDVSRFLIVFGTNAIGSTVLDPMLIRWSDQESLTIWNPAATNQAGDARLSHGSKIVTYLQSRQEILVWTDSSFYSMQYVGPPAVWQVQLLADNISIIGPNATALASGVAYWMGIDKFYKYDGRSQSLRCDLRQYIFDDINLAQSDQVFASTNEGFNEIWFFYCSAGTAATPNTTIDKYVIYNYAEDVWYYGSMGRTAWLDSGLRDYPIAATYSYNLVNHEYGLNDATDSDTGVPIQAYINSSQFDIDDGQHFGFIWRLVPDITFRGSTATTPSVTMTLLPLQNSGSGYNNPTSVGGSSYASISSSGNQAITVGGKAYEIEQFTGQVYTRVRGRQLSLSVYSNQLNTTWQLGAPRIDIRQDGRR